MAVKALIFGVDDFYHALKPYYDMAVYRGDLEIVGHASIEQGGIKLFPAGGGGSKTRLTLKLQ